MKKRLLLSGLVCSCFLILDSQYNITEAKSWTELDVTQIAINTDWQGASFPVEQFQGYTSLFGYRSALKGSKTEFHTGLDMSAPLGSYIRNWLSGRVIEVSEGTACGTSVKIASGNWVHVYCHMHGYVEITAQGRSFLDREGGIQIWEGQEVRAGKRIGRVGMTGRTTGPHLHWGLQYDNQWVDPSLVLQAMYNQQQTRSRTISRTR